MVAHICHDLGTGIDFGVQLLLQPRKNRLESGIMALTSRRMGLDILVQGLYGEAVSNSNTCM
jgi:hypothetical protein